MKNNTKLCVYAICKNESEFIDRWVDSLKDEADCVVVLDTGSTDDSVEKLKRYEPFVKVKQFDYFKELGYFRFDKARNDSLKLVPFDTDICVILDLDHVPRKGWAKIIKDKFAEGYSEVQGYIIDHHPETHKELNKWMSRNVHPNSPNWFWSRIIHEGIDYYNKNSDSIDSNPKTIFCEDFIIDHFPTEKKDRSLYKTLLEYACREYPKDPYYGIYLGIELSRRYSKQDSYKAFKRCLDECDFTNNKDIHYQCYINLANTTNDYNEALEALNKADDLDKNKTRRIYKLYAEIYEKLDEKDKAIESLEYALQNVTNYSGDWRDDASLFNGEIEDKLSLFYYYHRNDIPKSLEYAEKALSYNPSNERLINNVKLIRNKLEERGIN